MEDDVDCECLPRCPFFNDRMADMLAVAEIYKQTYCKGSFSTCARYVVFKAIGRENVPPDLYPNQFDRAHDIVTSS
jgi:hypothetical protein